MLEKFLTDGLMLWATIDPIGTLALFAAVTAPLTPALRRKTAIKAILYSTAILIGSIVIGQILLNNMGIDLDALQMAGGIILFLFGLKMIFGELDTMSSKSEPGHDIAVFPLAVPSIASPGAITAVIILTDNDAYTIPMQLGTTLILLFVLLVTFILMLAASSVMRVIGRNGAAILVRVMGLLLSALSVQLVINALHKLMA